MAQEDIKDITTYIPDKVSTEVLKDDWKTVMARWSQVMAGRDFTCSMGQVVDLAAIMYEEMKKREIEFHPDKMTPSSKKLYDIVSEKKAEDGGAEEMPSLDEDIEATLRSLPGLILIRPHGTMLASGEKTLLVKSAPFDIDGKEFYIVQEDEVLGIVEFNQMREITIEDFRKLEDGHKISEAERAEWWPEADKLYVYQIYTLNKFPEPIKIVKPKGAQTFVKNINFIEDQDITNIVSSGERTGPKLKLEEKETESDSDYTEFSKDAIVPDETTDAPQTKKKELLGEAKTSKESGAVPFRFFEMLKGRDGYKKQEAHSIKGVIELILPGDYPVIAEEKLDGMRIQIHKKGNKVKVLSIDGEIITDKVPTIVTEAKKQKDSVRDAELTGWEGGYREGKQHGRSTIADFIHSKEGLPHDNFYANTFDMLWFEGKDIHNSPLSERRKALESIGSTEHIKVIDMKLAKDPKELEKAIEWSSALEGSEGAMIKVWSSKYPLTGYTAKWIKYKIEVNLDAEVLDVHSTGSTTYNYLMILRDGANNPVPVGRTYNTPIAAKKGDILQVSFGDLNMYEDPSTKKAWFNWASPRVMGRREDKNAPDNDLTARRAHEETHGESSSKPYPKRYKDLLRAEINEHLEDSMKPRANSGSSRLKEQLRNAATRKRQSIF